MKQRAPNPPRSVGWVVAIALMASLPLHAGVEEDAERAWNSGDHATALELYERVLDDDPKNFDALLRSAKILSWNQRFDESIALYDRAIDLKPEDREAALGRARVLSWAGRLDASIEALDELDARYPDDRDIRLARANAQSWDGRYPDARDGFNVLLDENPDDVDARLGLARTYAWTGRTPRARTEYERALESDPGNVDARVGLAYLDLWGGEVGRAGDEAQALQAEHPENKEVDKLMRQVSRSAGAWWSVDLSQLDDTDDNRLRSYRVSGGLGLGRQVRLDLGVGHYDMSAPSGDASIDNIHAIVSFFPAKGQRIAASLGHDRRTRTDDTTDEDTLGGLTYTWGLDRRWQVRASAMRFPVRYSPAITDAGITFDQIELRADGAVGDRWRVHAAISGAEVSDDNERSLLHAGFLYRLPVSKVRLDVGYGIRVMDFDMDLGNGYFDPQDYVSHLARLRVADEYGDRGNYYRAYLDAGTQSFTLGGVDTSGDTVYVIGATAGFPLAQRFTLEGYAEHGDYAATTASGFESTLIGARLIWRAGLRGQ